MNHKETVPDSPAIDTGPEPEAGGESQREETTDPTGRQREIGGRKGPDPTRYGDWEKAGRCIDF